MLLSQTVEAEILATDACSIDATLSLVRGQVDRMRLLQIPRESFDHCGTRDFALWQSVPVTVFFSYSSLITIAGDFICLGEGMNIISANPFPESISILVPHEVKPGENYSYCLAPQIEVIVIPTFWQEKSIEPWFFG